jgi:hypothetical protein
MSETRDPLEAQLNTAVPGKLTDQQLIEMCLRVMGPDLDYSRWLIEEGMFSHDGDCALIPEPIEDDER